MIKPDLKVTQQAPSRKAKKILDFLYEEVERTGATVLAEGVETKRHEQVSVSWGPRWRKAGTKAARDRALAELAAAQGRLRSAEAALAAALNALTTELPGLTPRLAELQAREDTTLAESPDPTALGQRLRDRCRQIVGQCTSDPVHKARATKH